ncbi:sigma-70 family RNA polymerase sigma factor [Enterococcus faecalis]|uniref:Sigma-70 family RNA polymerase sigma factor n=1 Tax=Enterococcus cecorum TaxID=44008 RepID=A0A7X9NNX4_9ENTE|nr:MULTISPECIES: sigma-70 family RNA polymerase sigma factor [Lactobacillales]EGO6638216.1 sigma-70 family RNA polymerase sigma factor [Enterococcus faecalis]HEL1135467.1 sigma-70 family RNA polymerase sigma factor [Streptococcus equi subsp. zooepidemicus]EHQ8823918.1 sigma-70 family RNA polymerase sigma factor [Enterococcus faecalis]EHR4133122.1 sigma-70 family RNA polymerase sigma factor [Enterococcus faecalis]EIW2096658.1 sigma-70 family RNA polymerase sigma factor [Enterococcus faecalis]
MRPTSFENAIRLQFDTLVKIVIDRTVKNYLKELYRREKKEALFCEIPEIVIESFAIYDNYELDVTVFDVYGMEARVSGEELCKALRQLSEVKRNTLLMFYFLDMSDMEIAELLQISRVGVFKNRHTALEKMKELLSKNKMED